MAGEGRPSTTYLRTATEIVNANMRGPTMWTQYQLQ
jgi:hypothetical protein